MWLHYNIVDRKVFFITEYSDESSSALDHLNGGWMRYKCNIRLSVYYIKNIFTTWFTLGTKCRTSNSASHCTYYASDQLLGSKRCRLKSNFMFLNVSVVRGCVFSGCKLWSKELICGVIQCTEQFRAKEKKSWQQGKVVKIVFI